MFKFITRFESPKPVQYFNYFEPVTLKSPVHSMKTFFINMNNLSKSELLNSCHINVIIDCGFFYVNYEIGLFKCSDLIYLYLMTPIRNGMVKWAMPSLVAR